MALGSRSRTAGGEPGRLSQGRRRGETVGWASVHANKFCQPIKGRQAGTSRIVRQMPREGIPIRAPRPRPLPVRDEGIMMSADKLPLHFVKIGCLSWVVAVLGDTIQRASFATCNVRGSTFMNWPARES
jgi:hypothetical protein